MNKEIQGIRTRFDNAVSGVYELNQKVEKDIRFAFVAGSQWEGAYAEEFKHKPKPENNKVVRAVNRILGQYERLELNAKIMSNSDDATDEDAELLQSRWRNDFNHSDGVEAQYNAAKEAFTGGFGAFKLTAKFEDEESPDPQKQYLCVEPIYSAASSVVFNAGAVRKDKSDATECWQLLRVNRKDTEREYDKDITPFPSAASDNIFDWNCADSKDIYIANYWKVKTKSYTVFNFNDGEYVIERRGRKYFDGDNQEVDKEDFDAIMLNNEPKTYTRKVKEVWYSLIDGTQYLINPQRTPFKRVPIIPQYGYHTVINGNEYYSGEVAFQRDPQMFGNMFFGSLMEVMAERQTPINEYLPEQVEGSIGTNIANEKKNNAAYRVTLPVEDNNGNVAHMGPVGTVQPPQLGSAMVAAGQYLAISQEEQGGTGQSTLPANSSAEAVKEVNQRSDDTYQPLFQNAIQSIKALCQCWIPAAQVLYFNAARKLRVLAEDGSFSQVETMGYGVDGSGVYGPSKNTARGKYDVQVKMGESLKGKKEAERAAALEVLQYADTSTPIGQMALNTAIMATTGEGTQMMRKFARFQEIRMAIELGIDPNIKTEEEALYAQNQIQAMQAAAQNQQQDPASMIAQAEYLKAQVDAAESERDLSRKDYEAETNRMKAISDVNKTMSEIDKNQAETASKQVETALKALN